MIKIIQHNAKQDPLIIDRKTLVSYYKFGNEISSSTEPIILVQIFIIENILAGLNLTEKKKSAIK